ncbi:hypothetical protein L1785_18820 [Antribacter sp. KLBMP9083]|uniref:Tetratricopeptide repeat protein n=1 Tax=Antribacter soli TaxID=2910976 RepID=A0AA41QGH5_9MICO|nr:hypothetical protein [Antribacter soli]MCF4123033.1 hypothetical protein [Antribacter soli]
MTTTIPSWTSATFAEDVREHLARNLTQDQLRAILADESRPADERFTCLYTLLQDMHREEREAEYRGLVTRYEPEFGSNPYYGTFRAIAAIGDGTSVTRLRQALRHSRQAIKSLGDRPGVWHQYAALYADLGDLAPDLVTPAELGFALDAVDTALRTSTRDNPNFHFTRARLLHLGGRIREALTEVQVAIHYQEARTPGGVRRLARYEALRARLLIDRQGSDLLAQMAQTKAAVDTARGDQVQLLGVLAAVIALITTAVTVATRIDVSDGVPLILVATGSITIAFSCLMWAGGVRSVWRLVPGVVLGLLMCLAAIHLVGLVDLTSWVHQLGGLAPGTMPSPTSGTGG